MNSQAIAIIRGHINFFINPLSKSSELLLNKKVADIFSITSELLSERIGKADKKIKDQVQKIHTIQLETISSKWDLFVEQFNEMLNSNQCIHSSLLNAAHEVREALDTFQNRQSEETIPSLVNEEVSPNVIPPILKDVEVHDIFIKIIREAYADFFLSMPNIFSHTYSLLKALIQNTFPEDVTSAFFQNDNRLCDRIGFSKLLFLHSAQNEAGLDQLEILHEDKETILQLGMALKDITKDEISFFLLNASVSLTEERKAQLNALSKQLTEIAYHVFKQDLFEKISQWMRIFYSPSQASTIRASVLLSLYQSKKVEEVIALLDNTEDRTVAREAIILCSEKDETSLKEKIQFLENHKFAKNIFYQAITSCYQHGDLSGCALIINNMNDEEQQLYQVARLITDTRYFVDKALLLINSFHKENLRGVCFGNLSQIYSLEDENPEEKWRRDLSQRIPKEYHINCLVCIALGILTTKRNLQLVWNIYHQLVSPAAQTKIFHTMAYFAVNTTPLDVTPYFTNLTLEPEREHFFCKFLEYAAFQDYDDSLPLDQIVDIVSFEKIIKEMPKSKSLLNAFLFCIIAKKDIQLALQKIEDTCDKIDKFTFIKQLVRTISEETYEDVLQQILLYEPKDSSFSFSEQFANRLGEHLAQDSVEDAIDKRYIFENNEELLPSFLEGIADSGITEEGPSCLFELLQVILNLDLDKKKIEEFLYSSLNLAIVKYKERNSLIDKSMNIEIPPLSAESLSSTICEATDTFLQEANELVFMMAKLLSPGAMILTVTKLLENALIKKKDIEEDLSYLNDIDIDLRNTIFLQVLQNLVKNPDVSRENLSFIAAQIQDSTKSEHAKSYLENSLG